MENNLEPQNTNTHPKKHKPKRTLLVLLAIFLVIAMGFGVYYWQQKKINSLNVKVNDLNSTVEDLNQEVERLKPKMTDSTKTPNSNQKTANIQYVNEVPLELPLAFGDLLVEATTDEINTISSSTLLAKEKELYGDSAAYCTAGDYPLGRVTVRDVSTPFPGDTLIKKLESGKYLYYADLSQSSFCYQNREQLRTLMGQQVEAVKTALAATK